MKKADWLGAFVTLIATGIGYFVSGPKVAAACIIVGTLGALIIHYAAGKKESPGESPKAATGVKDSFNPTNTNTATGGQLTLEQHFHGVPAPPAPMTPPPAPVVEHPRSGPRLNFSLRGRPYSAHVEELDYRLVMTTPSHHSPRPQKAVLLDVGNYPHEDYSVSFASNVTAGYVFTEPENLSLGPLGWIGEGDGRVDISQNQTKSIVLMATQTSANDWRVPTHDPHYVGHYYQIFRWMPLPEGGPYTVKLTLSISGRIVFSVPLVLTCPANREPTIEVKPPS